MIRIRTAAMPLLVVQAGVLLALPYLPTTDPTYVFARTLFGITLVATITYATRLVPIPSVYHLFVAAYSLLFLVQPIVAPWVDLRLPAHELFNLYTRFTIGGLALLNIAYELASRPARQDERAFLVDDHRIARAFWVLLALYGCSLLMIVADAGSVGAIASASRVERIEQRGLSTLLSIYVITFTSGLFCLAPTVLAKRKIAIVPVAVVLLAGEALVFLSFRVRTFLLMHLVAFAIGYALLRPKLLPVRRNIVAARARRVRLLPLMLVGAFLLVLGTYVRFARGMLEHGGVVDFSRLKVADVLRLSLATGDFGYAPIVYQAMHYVPREHPFLNGQSYYRLLFIPIPRSLWRGKPENTERLVAEWLAPDQPEMTMPPGVQGDLYINFGGVGILGFAVFGTLLALVDRSAPLKRHLLVGTSATVVFHFVRGGFTNSVMLFATLLALTTWLQWYVTRRAPSARERLAPG
jgi:oligosaccharide repeat unit polymerase